MCAVMERSDKRAIMNEYFKLVSKEKLTAAEAAEELGIDVDTFLADMEKAGYKVPTLA